MFYLINLTLGIYLVTLLSISLPISNFVIISSVFATLFIFHLLSLCFYNQYLKFISNSFFYISLGMGLGYFNIELQRNSQLPLVMDKYEFIVKGSVQGLVNRQSNTLSFIFSIDSIQHKRGADVDGKIPPLKKIRLSWYGGVDEIGDLNAGEQWQFLARLRVPRGLVNFSGFDYQSWLIANRFSATGYVLASKHNHLVKLAECNLFCLFDNKISEWREAIQLFIFNNQLSFRNQSIISALTIGDKSGLSELWLDLSRFGIVHLVVISGLHIGLVFWLGFLVGSCVIRFIYLFNNVIKPNLLIRFIPPSCGFVFSFFYSLLAGFSLPTQRAMIVILFLILSKVFYFRLPAYVVFFWALMLIVFFQPFSIIGVSYWLSFSAVAILLFYFGPRISNTKQRLKLLSSQAVLFIGMLAPLTLFTGQFSWLGLLVNLIAVPIISVITVPLCLIAAMFFFLSPQLSGLLWEWASVSIDSLWFLLDLLPAELGLYYFSIPSSLWFFLSVVCLSLAFLLPFGLLSRWLLILPFTLHLLAHKPRFPLRVSVLDVGQGLSVVIESSSKLMVYDVGASYSRRFDMGAAVVAPFVRGRGIKHIEKIVISHGDNDHAGGLKSLTRLIPTQETILTPGFYSQAFQDFSYSGLRSSCNASRGWKWSYLNSSKETEWIYFDILLPKLKELGHLVTDSNNNSCVLLVRWRDISVLLPGDIEKQGERLLLENYNLPPINILVAPHHGSKTSSSPNFVDQLMPAHVVFSAGYRHHFGHPHADVVARYSRFGSEIWSTAEDGAVTFEWDDSGALSILTAKNSRAPFLWR